MVRTRATMGRWLSTNPIMQAEPPAAPKPNPQPPTAQEAARILAEAWSDPDWGALVWLAMVTGVRRGELCASGGATSTCTPGCWRWTAASGSAAGRRGRRTPRPTSTAASRWIRRPSRSPTPPCTEPLPPTSTTCPCFSSRRPATRDHTREPAIGWRRLPRPQPIVLPVLRLPARSSTASTQHADGWVLGRGCRWRRTWSGRWRPCGLGSAGDRWQTDLYGLSATIAAQQRRGAALRRLHRGLHRLRSRETSWASTPARRCRPGRRPAASRASVCCQRTAMQPEHGGPGGQTSTAANISCPHSATRVPVCPCARYPSPRR